LELDLATLSKGEHQLAVEVYNGSVLMGSRSYALLVTGDNVSLKKK